MFFDDPSHGPASPGAIVLDLLFELSAARSAIKAATTERDHWRAMAVAAFGVVVETRRALAMVDGSLAYDAADAPERQVLPAGDEVAS